MERAWLRSLVAATGCAREGAGTVFLVDPQMRDTDARRVKELMARRAEPAEDGRGWLGIASGGSSGGLKFARHDEHTLAAAVEGARRHFGVERFNVVDVLPAHHVSGFMARVRAAATGGAHVAWDWKRLEAGGVPPLPAREEGWVVSLVPTQLRRLLVSPGAREWLRGLRLIFVGGGPLWPQLADAAAEVGLPLAPCYGMTETAAMIAALRPEEFAAGRRGVGRPMPHARVMIGADGVVRVAGASVFHGYWPAWRERQEEFVTEDMGEWDAEGGLRILGRRDAIIITGGKKVRPEEVEAALLASGEFADVVVLGIPDPDWGEVVVACYPAGGGRRPEASRAAEALAPYQRPKRYVPIEGWARNPQGKIDRALLRAQLQAAGGVFEPL